MPSQSPYSVYCFMDMTLSSIPVTQLIVNSSHQSNSDCDNSELSCFMRVRFRFKGSFLLLCHLLDFLCDLKSILHAQIGRRFVLTAQLKAFILLLRKAMCYEEFKNIAERQDLARLL